MAQKTLELVSVENLQAEVDARNNAIANVTSMINKDLVIDIDFGASVNGVNATIDIINPATNTPNTYNKALPVASASAAGIMPKESFTQIQQNTNDIKTLMNQQGGKYIGVSFDSKADLDAYQIPTVINLNDFTYVAADETQNGSPAMYIYDGTTFKFARIINQVPVPSATDTTLGVVMGSSVYGKITVENDGTMSLNGYDELKSTDENLSNSIATKVTSNAPVVGATATKVTYDAKGLVTDSGNLVESDIPPLSQSKITGLSTTLSAKADQSAVDSLTSVTNTKITGNTPITPGTATKVTYDAKGLITGSSALVESDLPAISQSKITGLSTALAAKADQDDLSALETTVSNKVTANSNIAAGTATKITYDIKGLVTGGTSLVESDLPAISQSKITGLSTALAAKADQALVDALATDTDTRFNNIQTSLTNRVDMTAFNTLNAKVDSHIALKKNFVKELDEHGAGDVNFSYTGEGYIESIVVEVSVDTGTSANVDLSITVDGGDPSVYNHTFSVPSGVSRYAIANNHGSFETGVAGLYILKDMAPLVVDGVEIDFPYPVIQIDFATSINVSIKPSTGSSAIISASGIRITKILYV
jgi:hypothetical protein